MGLLRKTFGALFSSAIPDKPAHGMRWGIDKQYCKEIIDTRKDEILLMDISSGHEWVARWKDFHEAAKTKSRAPMFHSQGWDVIEAMVDHPTYSPAIYQGQHNERSQEDIEIIREAERRRLEAPTTPLFF